MCKVKKALFCFIFGLFLFPLLGYAAANSVDQGYAPTFVANKTIYVKFDPKADGGLTDFKLTFVKEAKFIERVLHRLSGQDITAAVEHQEATEAVGHGSYTYGKIGCNTGQLTMTFAEKQAIHPAGSTLVMQLKFTSETTGTFAAHFIQNGQPDEGKADITGTFELK